MRRTIAAIFLLGAAAAPIYGHAEELVQLDIPTLPTPSLGYFTAPVIKAKELDKAHGLEVEFVQKPAGTYRTDFAAGTDRIGGSGTVLADVALLSEKGVETVYLFNVFDFWGTVVVRDDSDIHELSDLTGKTIAASLPTTNFAMFRYFADVEGLDLSTVQIQGAAVPGLVPMAKSGRVDGVQMWEPAHSILTHGNDEFRAIDLVSSWKETSGETVIPYLGFSAHRSWVEENPEVVEKLYGMYSDAAKFIQESPQEAAEIISEATDIDVEILLDLVRSDRLGLNVYWAADEAEAIKAVFEAAVQIGYLSEMPDEEVLYDPQ